MNDREFAIMEAGRNAESDEYFDARRPDLDNVKNRLFFERGYDAGFKAAMRILMKEQADTHAIELRAYEATVANLVEALRGVIRVADRATDEFDAAKAAIFNAVGDRHE